MSKVTLKDIREQFPEYTQHEQLGCKQLFICSQLKHQRSDNKYSSILVSYHTVVGYSHHTHPVPLNGKWVLTKYKYSLTTSRQLSQFARGRNVLWIDEPVGYGSN